MFSSFITADVAYGKLYAQLLHTEGIEIADIIFFRKVSSEIESLCDSTI